MRIFTTQVRVGVLCAVMATACIVAACGASPVVVKPTTTATSSSAPAQLFADDFQGACQGATVSRATPYAEAGTSHKVILFGPNDGKLYEDTSTLPADWMVQYDTNSDAYAKVDTVACEEVESEQTVKQCTGYTKDDHETNNEVTLNTATYKVTVHEATTGKVLGTTELDGTDDTCPMFMSFDDENQKKTYDAPPSKEDVVAFVKPFVQP